MSEQLLDLPDLETRVAGIPCQVRVTYYQPYDPGVWWGHPDQRTPEEGPDLEVELYDRKGYRARWLEQKLTDRDIERLRQELEELRRESEREGWD